MSVITTLCSGRPSKDPENIDYVPTVFKDGKRRVGTVATDRNREERRTLRSRKLEERKDREEERRVLLEVENAAAVLVDLSTSRITSEICPGSVVEDETDKEPAHHESLLEETVRLQAANQELLFRVIALEKALNTATSSSPVSIIISNDDATMFHTGIPYYRIFKLLSDYMEPILNQVRSGDIGRRRKLTTEEELLSVLMRLRLGLLAEDVARRFEVSPSTYSRIFFTWIKLLAIELKKMFPWPSKELIAKNTPAAFKKYPNTRIIIDCTEFYVQRPSSLQGQALTFHTTSITTLSSFSLALVLEVSLPSFQNYGEEEYLIKQSLKSRDYSTYWSQVDNVMADREFDISKLLQAKGVTLNIPPFLGQRQQLSSLEVIETRRIASIRMHVEHAIGRMKNYRLLQYVIPLTLADIASDIVCVCAYLTNFCKPIVSDQSH